MTMQNETTDQRRAPRRLLGARRRTPPGAAPGTMIADPAALPPRIRVIAYGADKIEELSLDSPEPIAEILGRHAVTWIDVCGLGDIETINRIGALFDLHNLALEDVVNTHQRPKAEEYDDFLFVVLSLVSLQQRLETEQISMFVGENFVITFQERHGDCFEPVRDRLRRQRGRVRSSGADYLAYALIDSAIDSCFPVLEDFGERVEAMEDRV
ncbi:MAG: CorA family divalent cation transporter, partial [Rickettsiales bacterium]